MTAEGDARRALLGEHAVQHAREVAATLPPPDPADRDRLALLLRTPPPGPAPADLDAA